MDLSQWLKTDFRTNEGSIKHSNANAMGVEVVEISSDEEEERETNAVNNGHPESGREVAGLSSPTKRVVDLDDIDTIFDQGMETYYHDLGAIRGKRQKLGIAQYQNILDQAIDAPDMLELWHDAHTQLDHDFPYQAFIDWPGTRFENEHGHSSKAGQIRPASQTRKTLLKSRSIKKKKNAYVPMEVHTKSGKFKLTAPPYYDDPMLQARMYRGPGFEKYSSVLCLNTDHQEICDEWDSMQLNRKTMQERRRSSKTDLVNRNNDAIANEDNEDGNDSGDETTMEEIQKVELECFTKVHEVLPDAQRTYILKQVRKYMESYASVIDGNINIQLDPAAIVNEILEVSEYPKQGKPLEFKQPAADGTGVTIAWHKGDIKGKSYQRHAIVLLAGDLLYVPTHFIQKSLQEQETLFATYCHIARLEMNYPKLPPGDRPYRRLQDPRLSFEQKYATKDENGRDTLEWENLVNELQAAKQQVERDRISRSKKQESETKEAANLAEHKATDGLLICQCCFDEETPLNRAVSCNDKDTHWFCFSCVLGLAESQVGLMRFEMNCMHQSGCKAPLSKDGLGLALPTKLIDKMAFYQQQHEIMEACIEGLEQCPFCDFKAICDPIEDTSVFRCQNPDCLRISCRRCREDSHLPKSCEDLKADRQISARHQVEEARSEAMMRTCPQCKVKIVKEVGCNKLKCGRCGCAICYVCQADISKSKDNGYSHFNEPKGKCVLYDKSFDRHEAEAYEAEKEAIKRVQAEVTDIDEKQLQIATGKPREATAPRPAQALHIWPPGARPPMRHAHREHHAALDDVMREHRLRIHQMYLRHRNDPRADRGRLGVTAAGTGTIPAPHIDALQNEVRALQDRMFPTQDVINRPRPPAALEEHRRRVQELHNQQHMQFDHMMTRGIGNARTNTMQTDWLRTPLHQPQLNAANNGNALVNAARSTVNGVAEGNVFGRRPTAIVPRADHLMTGGLFGNVTWPGAEQPTHPAFAAMNINNDPFMNHIVGPRNLDWRDIRPAMGQRNAAVNPVQANHRPATFLGNLHAPRGHDNHHQNFPAFPAP